MTERFLLLSISGLLGAMAFGEPLADAPSAPEAATEIQAPAEIEPPAELTATIREQDAATKTLEQKDAEERKALRDWYSASLDTMRQDAISQGELERVIALDLERARIETDISPEEKAKLFYALRELRGRYDRQRAEQVRHISAEARAGLQRYAVALDHLAGIFLQHGNVAAARVVERARLSMLGAPPTTAVASVSIHASSSSASLPPAPGHASTSGSKNASSGSGSKPPVAVAPAPGAGKSAPGVPSVKQGSDVTAKTKPASSGSGKVATVKSGPSATSVSAPVSQVARQTTRPAAQQGSGRSAPSAPRAIVARPAGPSAPGPIRAPAGGGESRPAGIVVR